MLFLSTLGRHGYQFDGDGKAQLKPLRPATIGDGRKLIAGVFEANKWDERDRAVYTKMKLGTAKDLNDLTADEIRTILAAMEKSRMLLFRD